MISTTLIIGIICVTWIFFIARNSSSAARYDEARNPLYSEQSLEAELSERLAIDLSGHTGRFNGDRANG